MANPPEAVSSDDQARIAAGQLVQKGSPLSNKWILAIAIFAGQAGAHILFARLVSPEEEESNWVFTWLVGLVLDASSCKVAGLILGVRNCTWLKSVLLAMPSLFLSNILTSILPIPFWWSVFLAYFIIFPLWSHIVLRLTTLGTIVFVLLAIATSMLAAVPTVIIYFYGIL